MCIRDSQKINTEASFAAAGHTDANGVRRQITRIVHDGAIFGLPSLEIVGFAQVEEAETFDVFHAGDFTAKDGGAQERLC